MASVLLIDDDVLFCEVLANAFCRRGYSPAVAHDSATALTLAREAAYDYAVLDLRLATENGLQMIPALIRLRAELRIVVLTGYASIATAVEAIKLGAHHYLTKPADPDVIIAAFSPLVGREPPPVSAQPASLERVEWEYIQRTLTACDGNVTTAADRLGLHRRTLQRKLKKRPPGLH